MIIFKLLVPLERPKTSSIKNSLNSNAHPLSPIKAILYVLSRLR